jgi:aminoglycoside phosphotransferase (APT) family kinase protein
MKVYPERIAASLQEAFPELAPIDGLTILSDGVRSLVVETPTGEVFKVARSWDAGAGYVKEMRLLPLIRHDVPVPVPFPVWHAGPSKHFPFGVLGYPRLDGTLLSADCVRQEPGILLAKPIGEVLAAIHQLPLNKGTRSAVPQPRARWEDIQRLRNTLVPPLRELFSAGDYKTIQAWWDSFLGDVRMRRFNPVLHHGDFWHGNMLTESTQQKLAGLIDFEDSAAGDPAQDIATLLHLGKEFTVEVLTGYQRHGGILDDDVLYRAQRLWELREFFGIGFAIQTTNQTEFDAAVAKLRNGPLLNETTRRETQLWPPQPQ